MNPQPQHDFFNSIVDIQNIEQAYLEVIHKFDKESKSNRYRGIDGLKMSSLDFSSKEVLEKVREEMITFSPIAPAYMTTIPKKNGKKRKIYVYSVKERIKAEAIYRALLPFFDAYLSPYLFSYRSSHPSYFAARSAVRRYKRYYGQNHVLVTDISDYADTIDHTILLEKLTKLGIDAKTLKLLELFIKTDTFEQGTLIKRPRGVLTGTPLYALLSNFYMDEFDVWAGKYVSFYRRVGDDIIAMDKNKEKIVEVHARLVETVDRLKLKLNLDKAKLITDTEEFKFLGYSFRNGRIGFDASSRAKVVAHWKKEIVRKNMRTDMRKVKHINSLFKNKNNMYEQHNQLIKQKILVDDVEQIKEFSESFFKLVTKFFRKKYSPKARREIAPLLRKTKLQSLFTQYTNIRYPANHDSSK